VGAVGDRRTGWQLKATRRAVDAAGSSENIRQVTGPKLWPPFTVHPIGPLGSWCGPGVAHRESGSHDRPPLPSAPPLASSSNPLTILRRRGRHHELFVPPPSPVVITTVPAVTDQPKPRSQAETPMRSIGHPTDPTDQLRDQRANKGEISPHPALHGPSGQLGWAGGGPEGPSWPQS
jgi:hypothetical protein